MLALYHSPISTCSQKVRLCLYEKGLSFESHVLNLEAQEHLSPDYLAINPNGVVPALIHDGMPIIDSSVIMEYLEEVFPGHSLMPPTAWERARVRAWMRYIEEVPTVAIRYPSFNTVLLQTFERMSADEFQHAAESRPLRKHFYQQMGQKGFAQEAVENSMERLRQTAERMEKALSDTAFVAADTLTIADFALVPTFDRMRDLKLAHVWADLPGVEKWWTQINERPAFAAAYGPGSRFSEVYDWERQPQQDRAVVGYSD